MTVLCALDAVGDEHAAQVGLAGDELAVAAADDLDVRLGDVVVVVDVLHRHAHAAGGAVFLHLDRQAA